MGERRVAKPATCACRGQVFYRRGMVEVLGGSQIIRELDADAVVHTDPDSLQCLKPYQCAKCGMEYTHAELLQRGGKDE